MTRDLPTAVDVPTGPRDCGALVEAARDEPQLIATRMALCDDVPLSALDARAWLLTTADSATAANRAPALVDFDDLQQLARLAGHVAVAEAGVGVGELEAPQTLNVTPINPAVLAQVQLAHALIRDPATPYETRTRARAVLAKVHVAALKQIGLHGDAPFVRLLAGQALSYTIDFCVSYWQRRVAGLAPLFRQLEVDMLNIVLALQPEIHVADVGLTQVMLERARHYLSRPGPRERVGQRVDEVALAPIEAELDRLVDHGFIDLAGSLALELARREPPPSLAAIEQLLDACLVRHDADEYRERLMTPLERLRRRGDQDGEEGGELIVRPTRGTSPERVAEAIEVALRRPPAPDFRRRVVMQTMLVTLAHRPDALRFLIGRLAHEPVGLRSLAGHFEPLAARWDDGHRRWLRARLALDRAFEQADDDATRRAFALALRASGDTQR